MGCDTVPQMFGIRKLTALKVLSRSYTLEKLGDKEEDFERIVSQASVFVAKCYGSTITTNMSEIRYHT